MIVHTEKIIQKPLVLNILILAGGQKNVIVMMSVQPLKNAIVEFAAQHLLLRIVVADGVAIEDMEILPR